jgi:hypothetical protein
MHVALGCRQVLVTRWIPNRPRRSARHRKPRTERVPQDADAVGLHLGDAGSTSDPVLHDLLSKRRSIDLTTHREPTRRTEPPGRSR